MNRIIAAQEFCERWVDKAMLYDTNTLEDVFDRYFTLFVAFNRAYAELAIAASNIERRDRQLATRVFPQIVGHPVLWDRLNADMGSDDIVALRLLIGPTGRFFLVSAGHPDVADDAKNRELYRRLGSRSKNVVVEAVLDYLYQVRCNMFHGAKAYEHRQVELLQPCTRTLERVVASGIDAMRERLTV